MLPFRRSFLLAVVITPPRGSVRGSCAKQCYTKCIGDREGVFSHLLAEAAICAFVGDGCVRIGTVWGMYLLILLLTFFVYSITALFIDA